MLMTTYERGVVAANMDSVILRERDSVITAQTTPVVYCHHATGTAQSAFPPAAWSLPAGVNQDTDRAISVICERLTVLGHPVIASDQGSSQSWGNDAAQAEVTAALNRLAAVTGCRNDKVLLLGDSMGSFLALSWARLNPTKVAAVACLLPIPDIRYVYANPGGNVFNTAIDTAYGGSANYASAEPARNPARSPGSFKDMALSFWYSNNDVVGAKSEVTDFMAEVRATGGSGSTTATDMGAFGHAIPLTFNVNDVCDFLHAHR